MRLADQPYADDGKAHLFPEACRERREELLVLLRGADRDAQVLGQLVGAAAGANDGATAQQPLEDLGSLAHPDGEEVAVRRDEVEAETARALFQLAHAVQVLGIAPRDE